MAPIRLPRFQLFELPERKETIRSKKWRIPGRNQRGKSSEMSRQNQTALEIQLEKLWKVTGNFWFEKCWQVSRCLEGRQMHFSCPDQNTQSRRRRDWTGIALCTPNPGQTRVVFLLCERVYSKSVISSSRREPSFETGEWPGLLSRELTRYAWNLFRRGTLSRIRSRVLVGLTSWFGFSFTFGELIREFVLGLFET